MLDAEAVIDFSARSCLSSYPSHTEIVAQGELLDKVGIIARGLLKLASVTENGEEHLLQTLGSGDLICMPAQARSLYYWTAVTEVDVCWLSRKAWEAFLEEQPQSFHSYMVVMHKQLEAFQRSIMNMRGRNTLQRVAYWILEELSDFSDEQAIPLTVRLSRRELASLLDMTPETLCRSLHQLDVERALRIVTPDQFEITNLDRLRLIAHCQDEHAGGTFGQKAAIAPSVKRVAGHASGVEATTLGHRTAARARATTPSIRPRTE